MKPPDDDRKGPRYRAEISRVADVVGAATAVDGPYRGLRMDAKIKRTTLAIKLTELEITRTNLAIKKTDLQMARVSLASKKTERRTGRLKLAIARVGLVAAILGVVSVLVLLFVRLQVGHDRERARDAHAATEERVIVLVADQAADELLPVLGRHLLPAFDVLVVDAEARAGGQLATDSTHPALPVGDGLPGGEVQAVLGQRRRRRCE
jgi:hypothetical protein